AMRRFASPLLLSVAITGTLLLGGVHAAVVSPWQGPGVRPMLPPASKLETDTISPPCHPNPHAQSDMATLATRGDIRFLPQALRDRLLRLAGRPHTVPPMQAFAEADQAS